MTATQGAEQMLLNATSSIVSSSHPDLTMRAMGILLECKITDQPQTVRGLAHRFNINRPAVTRAVDRLERLKYVSRARDPLDARSVLVSIKPEGRRYIARMTGEK